MKIEILLCVIGLMFAFTGAAEAKDTCGRAKLVSGNSCETLKVEFDLKGCGEGSEPVTAKVFCKQRYASYKTSKFMYTTHLTRSEGAWNNVQWGIVKDITKAKVPGAKKEVAIAEPPPAEPEKTEAPVVEPTVAATPPVTMPVAAVVATAAAAAEIMAPVDEPSAPAVSVSAPAPVVEAAPVVAAEVASAPEATTPAVNPVVETAPVATEVAPPPAEEASRAPAAVANPWKATAILDAYYAYNFNKPADTTALAGAIPSGNNLYRAYDIYSRQITLNLLEVSLSHKTEEVSFLVDFDFGNMADINAKTPPGFVVDEGSKHIGQAYITYTPKLLPSWSFDLGKFYTFVGLEVTKAKDNWNYSRSLLYNFGIPFWHSGIHARFTPGAKFSTGFYVLNGWNTMYNITSGQTFGLQLKFTPNENLAVIYNGITGPQQSASGVSNLMRTEHEVNVTYNFTPKLSMGLDFVDGMEELGAAPKDMKWTAYSAALKFQINDSSYISPRYESFKDANGKVLDTTLIQTMQSMTLTYGYKSASGVETRFEYRQDTSDQKAFTKGDGSTTSTQDTALVAFLYAI